MVNVLGINVGGIEKISPDILKEDTTTQTNGTRNTNNATAIPI
jgi:hypothetical protein